MLTVIPIKIDVAQEISELYICSIYYITGNKYLIFNRPGINLTHCSVDLLNQNLYFPYIFHYEK